MPGESVENEPGKPGLPIPGAIAMKIRFACALSLTLLLVVLSPLNRVLALQDGKSATNNPTVEAQKTDSANPAAAAKTAPDDKATAAKPADFKPPTQTQDKII